MSQFKSQVMDESAVLRALRRISYEIVEHNRGAEELALVGICRRGVPLAERIAANIEKTEGVAVPVGKLDITFYRDDIREHAHPDPVLAGTELPFSVTGRRIVLVDDVLYTGRTARAALDALLAHGRPAVIQLAVLCDRGHRELPIRADYVGKNLPTSSAEMVVVKIPPYDDAVCVELHDLVR